MTQFCICLNEEKKKKSEYNKRKKDFENYTKCIVEYCDETDIYGVCTFTDDEEGLRELFTDFCNDYNIKFEEILIGDECN